MIISIGFREYIEQMGFRVTTRTLTPEHEYYLWKPHDFIPYFKITKGKFAGSIGRFNHVSSIMDVGDGMGITRLIPKNMQFLKDYDGPGKVVVANPKPQYDINGDEITIGDLIMFPRGHNITFGKVISFSHTSNDFTIATSIGYFYCKSKALTIVNFDIDSIRRNITVGILQYG